jgi:hypothetical protein
MLVFVLVTLEGLEWNTFENMVIKWNNVFNYIALDETTTKYA